MYSSLNELSLVTSRSSTSSDVQVVNAGEAEDVSYATVDHDDVILSAHYGYIYALTFAFIGEQTFLISGGMSDSGVETCDNTAANAIACSRGWKYSGMSTFLLELDHMLIIQQMWLSCPEGLNFHHHLLDEQEEGVLALEVKDSTTLCASFQGGKIRVFDLATFTMLRTLSAGTEDVISLARLGDCCVSTCADGTLQIWNKAFSLESSRTVHSGIALSCSASCDGQFIYTGGNDGHMKVWYRSTPQSASVMQSEALHGK